MQIEAAVFRKVLQPLTIEAIDIDKPLGREVLVRTVATETPSGRAISLSSSPLAISETSSDCRGVKWPFTHRPSVAVTGRQAARKPT